MLTKSVQNHNVVINITIHIKSKDLDIMIKMICTFFSLFLKISCLYNWNIVILPKWKLNDETEPFKNILFQMYWNFNDKMFLLEIA